VGGSSVCGFRFEMRHFAPDPLGFVPQIMAIYQMPLLKILEIYFKCFENFNIPPWQQGVVHR
jgi:hypothetical protein